MKVKLFLALMFTLFVFGASAQNPIEKIFKVEYRTATGKDTVIEVSSHTINSFNFIGNKGEVQRYNETTGEWETIEEENKDIFLNVYNVTDTAAYIKVGFSEVTPNLGFETFGCCISKTPNPEVSDYYMGINKYIGGTFDLAKFSNIYGEGCYTMRINSSNISEFEFRLRNLGYITTYYIRPYVKLNNGFIMYGAEKSFTAQKTKAAALAGEEELKGHLLIEDSIVFTKKAMQELFDNETEINDTLLWSGMIQDLKYLVKTMTNESRAELLKNIYNTIECTDGNLQLIKKFPENLVKHFKEYFVGGIEFSATEVINKSYSHSYDFIDTVYCDKSLGVPYNCYIRIVPASSTGRPPIGLNIPKYLHNNKEYAIYAVFVHPDIVNDPRPYKFNTTIYERRNCDTSKDNYRKTQQLIAPEEEVLSNKKDYITDISNSVDTVFIGKCTFMGTPEPIIQFQTSIGRQEKEYNRVMCISKLYIIPVKENE